MADQELIDNETKAAFVGVDEDGDGKISHAQLRVCLRSLCGVKKLPGKIVQSVLDEADQDGSGYINYEEFCNAIGTCTLLETINKSGTYLASGHAVLPICTENEWNAYDELYVFVPRDILSKEDPWDIYKVIQLFISCDRDKSGFISASELRTAVANLPAAPRDNVHAEEILAECDVDGDGYLSFEEFANHVLSEEEEHQVL